jgi:PAS domain S-box-containing protein
MQTSTSPKFDLVFECSPIGMAVVDPQFRFVRVNEAYCKMVGYQHEELLELCFMDITHPDDISQDLALATELLRGDRTFYRLQKRYIRKDGKIVWLNLTALLVPEDSGMASHALAMVEDVTDQKTLEKVQQDNLLLQQRESFITLLTHDLKNPLIGANRVLRAVIDGKLGPLTSEQKDILSRLFDSNDSLIEMATNLLDLYRYESAGELFLEQNDLMALIVEAINIVSPAADARSIHIEFEASAPIICNLDRVAMRRVVMNLLDNAIKFSSADSSVFINVAELDNAVQFSVRDTGPGLSQAEQDRLFGRFWQGGIGRGISQGSGLGLYLCKAIVEAHRGSIACSSQINGGTQFIVTLPHY